MLNEVHIQARARLHFTLIDMHGSLGRVDGGVGLAIESPAWSLRVSRGPGGGNPPAVRPLLTRLRASMGFRGSFSVEVLEGIPRHIGLGSTTQLSLALAKAISLLEYRHDSIRDLAVRAGRGGTSGIGVAAFEGGGLILDGGHSRKVKPEFLPSRYSRAPPPPVLSRLEWPDAWRVVVAVPRGVRGLHGVSEKQAFRKSCPVPRREVERLTRLVLMKLLPAASEGDIASFGEALNRTQLLGFKKVENRLAPKVVREIRRYMARAGAAGAGLSSLGPAVFGIVGSDGEAENIAVKTARFIREKCGRRGVVFVTRGWNRGASVSVVEGR